MSQRLTAMKFHASRDRLPAFTGQAKRRGSLASTHWQSVNALWQVKMPTGVAFLQVCHLCDELAVSNCRWSSRPEIGRLGRQTSRREFHHEESLQRH